MDERFVSSIGRLGCFLAGLVIVTGVLPERGQAQTVEVRAMRPGEQSDVKDRVSYESFQQALRAGRHLDLDGLDSAPPATRKLVGALGAVLDGRLAQAEAHFEELLETEGAESDVARSGLSQLLYSRGAYGDLTRVLGGTPPIVTALAEPPLPTVGSREGPAEGAIHIGARGHIGVVATVSGHEQLFWVDTGASMSVLSDSVAALLGVVFPHGEPIDFSTATTGSATGRIGVLPSLRLSGVEFRHHRVIVFPTETLRMRSSERDWGTLHAILGWNALKAVRLELDAEGRTFRASVSDGPPPAEAATLTWFGYPLVRLLTPAGQPLLFGLDTGSWNTSLTRKGRETLGLDVARTGSAEVVGVGGAEIFETTYVDGVSLSLGDVRLDLNDVPTEEESGAAEVEFFEVDGVLGGDVLHRVRAVIDFGQREFTLQLSDRDPGE